MDKRKIIYLDDAIETVCEEVMGVFSVSLSIGYDVAEAALEKLPSAQPEQHEIGYSECANAMLKMWVDNVLTDGEYNRIMDKLNAHWAKRRV